MRVYKLYYWSLAAVVLFQLDFRSLRKIVLLCDSTGAQASTESNPFDAILF